MITAAPNDADAVTVSGPTKVVVDHKTGTVGLVKGNKHEPVEDGDEKRAPVSKPVVVQVIKTNTALYTFEMSAEKVEAREIAVLKSFLGALGPYLVELGKALTEARDKRPKAPTGVVEEIEQRYNEIINAVKALSLPIEERLKRIDQLIVELGQTELWTLQALDSMDHPAAKLPDVARRLRERLRDRFRPLDENIAPDDCGVERVSLTARLKATTDSIDAYRELTEHLVANRPRLEDELGKLQELSSKIDETLKQTSISPEDKMVLTELRAKTEAAQKAIDLLIATAKKALSEAEDFLAEAYRIEAVATAAMTARDTWCSDPIKISLSTGRKITIEIAPRKPAQQIRLARNGSLKFGLTLQPDWPVRPIVGLAFLSSSRSRFPIYSTKKAGDKFEIVESDQQDSRFTYGLSLGLTWRGLDGRDETGMAIWLPELTINPSDDVKAVGLGAAVSFWKIVKVGGGRLWTRHKALDGQAPGLALGAAEDLRLKDSYGKAHWYVSFALVGWPPFLQK